MYTFYHLYNLYSIDMLCLLQKGLASIYQGLCYMTNILLGMSRIFFITSARSKGVSMGLIYNHDCMLPSCQYLKLIRMLLCLANIPMEHM